RFMLSPTGELVNALRPNPRTYSLLVILIPLAAWAMLAQGFIFFDGNRISPDSANYIDCARSLRAGHGFLTRPGGGLDARLWEPITLWPPGYPLLISVAMRAGLDDYSAALAISIGCSAIVVVLLCAYYSRRLPFVVALLSSLVLVCMPSFLNTTTMSWSEG